MSKLAIAMLVLQGLCALHALKTQQERYWIMVVLFIPGAGAAIYFAFVMVPSLLGTRSAKNAARKVRDQVDPERTVRLRDQKLRTADTVENKARLAEGLLERGQGDEAVKLYKEILRGVYADDPRYLQGLASAYFLIENYRKAKQTLDELIAKNPDFKSQEAHLFYARSCEALGDNAAAEHEYQAVIEYFVGPEARVRYGMLLRKLDRLSEAREVIEAVLVEAKTAPDFYRRQQREWLLIARRERAKLG